MEVYKAESARIMELLETTGAAIEPMSIDEAYMELQDVAGRGAAPVAVSAAGRNKAQAEETDAALHSAVPLAREIKQRILNLRQLTATVGVAANKLLAKLASDYQKPDGLTLIPERDKVQFLRPLPVRSLHGVGKATEDILKGAGIQTIGDLQDYGGDLRALVGSFATRLKAFAFGEDDRPLELGEIVKSISSEETFLRDTDDRRILKRSLQAQAAEVASKLQRRQLAARTVQVKLRYGDFTTLTRQVSFEEPVTQAAEIYRLACFLLARERLVSRPLRLLGLGVTGLDLPSSRQLFFW